MTAAFLEKAKVRWYVRGIDCVIANGDEQKESIEEVVPREKVVLLRLPVDFDSFFCEVRKIFSPIVLLAVGSLSPARRFEDIILAAENLRDKGYETKVNIVCRDFSKNSAYKDFLLRLTEEKHMRKTVKFYFEGASEDNLRKIQSESHIFVFPNNTRIWSMIAFESMAAGLALVVSDATNVAEVLKNGENAIFSKSGNPSSIAEGIKYLFDNPETYKKIARNGQEFVRTNLTWKRYVEKVISG